MVFSSLLFVFLFLALNLVSQAALQGVRKKNIAMLIFSMVFFSWAGPRYVVLLLLDTALCWFFAVRIEREPKRKKLYLTLCVALVLLVLGIFKYTGFLLENLQSLFGVPELIPEIVLPIGISFYTFQLISYVVTCTAARCRHRRNTGCCFCTPACSTSALPVPLCATAMWRMTLIPAGYCRRR